LTLDQCGMPLPLVVVGAGDDRVHVQFELGEAASRQLLALTDRMVVPSAA
jgi:hypothetical protein